MRVTEIILGKKDIIKRKLAGDMEKAGRVELRLNSTF